MGLYANRKAAGKCVQCGTRPARPNVTRCQICEDKRKPKEQARRDRGAAVGKCRCGRQAETGKKRCEKCGVLQRQRKASWLAVNPNYNKEQSRKRFIEALDAYGGPICSCCGETSVFFLTLDHINNDGAEHRRRTKGASGKVLAWVLKKEGYPPGFQVLCFNCNCGKARNGGVCPHHGEAKWL